MTPGVVRVGDTVRRPCGPHSAFVHRLLQQLEMSSFAYAPRFLGIDDRGREILTFFEGEVPEDLGDFSDAQIDGAAELIRRFHDATSQIPLSGDEEVVCHGDLSPCNFVFDGGRPIGIIDFDTAAPGPRRHDVGYAIWMWLDIGEPDLSPHDVGRRIGRFLGSYGEGVDFDPIAAVRDAQTRLNLRNVDSDGHDLRPTAAWARECRQWVDDHREALEAACQSYLRGAS